MHCQFVVLYPQDALETVADVASDVKDAVIDGAEVAVDKSKDLISSALVSSREKAAQISGFLDDSPSNDSKGNPLIALVKLLLPIGACAWVLFHHGGEGPFSFTDDLRQ